MVQTKWSWPVTSSKLQASTIALGSHVVDADKESLLWTFPTWGSEAPFLHILVTSPSYIVSLDLRNNNFIGFLPQKINLLHCLRILMLSSNQLEGSIPPALHSCLKLRRIGLNTSQLMGSIPSTIGNMSSLEVLNLEFNNLTGPFPFVIFNITSLAVIALIQNHISRTLPMNLCSHCPNLQGLYLYDKEFNGRLSSLMNYCKQLSLLSLSYNKFGGSIPEGFGSLEKLEDLYLGGNSLTVKTKKLNREVSN
ncbi:receptor-like protein 1 [Alnus glutinosa]|uniref:receptor-like protein 1 n=1 Tax=Alnus glutinosa TaxID=3517 RepID=UPI002D76D264|nr:receptor-like protein 1 [Alnus glutinosa]